MNLVHSKQLLADAFGRSEFVVAVFADIRGFSKFSRMTESPNIAMYVKRLYLELLNKYFGSAHYAKPTGDGLLLIFPHDEKSLLDVYQSVVDSCLKCHAEFGSLCAGDLMLNFKLPESIGFGIARGTVCCLFSGDQIIDYSGHLLNLAARLNDLARPSGVVLDGNFQTGLLREDQSKRFAAESVYLRGVAEDSPVGILVQKEAITLSARSKLPFQDEEWQTEERLFSIDQLKGIDGSWHQPLKKAVLNQERISIRIQFDSPEVKGFFRDFGITKFDYREKPKPTIFIDVDALTENIPFERLKKKSKIKLIVSYPAIA